jgi:mannose-1-phosphate guanylyltransferase
VNWLVVLAGGRGERFWPLSRQRRPKQFLRLLSDRTMIQETVDRVAALFPPERTLVVTGADYVDLVCEQLPAVPRGHVLGEPVGRNTAPSVAWAARWIMERDPEAVLTVLPSDHAILRPEAFRKLLRQAVSYAAETGRMTLFGIVPDRPETGFGYIEVARPGPGPIDVVRFVEKPDVVRAREMVASGRHYWNSGMFVLPLGTFWATLERTLPEVAGGAETLVRRPGAESAVFAALPEVSLDVGVMERAGHLAVMPADIGWDDVGTFAAVARIRAEQQPDRVHLDRTDDVVVIGEEGPWVAGIGIRHLVVVRTPDVVLILPPEEAQEVRQVVRQLAERGCHELL